MGIGFCFISFLTFGKAFHKGEEILSVLVTIFLCFFKIKFVDCF